MLKKLLIANRGEVALNILRNCRELGIETVVVYSNVDKEQPAVYLADQAVCIGAGKSQSSYLNESNILMAALETGCDSIHPGYGFLSEKGDFADKVEKCGLKLVGPSSEVMRTMGDKISSKNLMISNGVPTVPGFNEEIKSKKDLIDAAEKLGFPILLKASAGGGGKGMRKVSEIEELVPTWELTKREAQASFSNDTIYMEKFIENPRHIEVQILADSYGNVIHLFERECSLQRNNQKILEEAPSIFLSENLLEKIRIAAVNCAQACNYEGAGTVEFIVDKDENFYFMEMNTRLQVEHAVTEMITGINIVKEQLKIASGLPLSIKQSDVKKEGHSIEIRVNAQDPLNSFQPQCGEVSFYLPPGGMDTRFESSLYKGAEILPFYDPMVAKLIVKDKTRLGAIKKMRRAIEETIIDGVKTNLGFQYAILHDKDFIRGRINTGYLREKEESLVEAMRSIEKGE
ncbi:MAG: acetyl-CoA carboxylase biotin carboxylase subunit [Peptoniphilus sp.]|uniref:acetyl-CoA carboxylase biotin carboxylase subunit n=1 Tax=Peptoniphilus sp. TaxID=1971214 RepID=UPI002A7601A4|nr:acetyl-CoA carboxylase biotin carboxylase subunit [Peptoniphilus sp.]MDY2986605.1 acetyl-CoA carboxylase biotin carboxylase subunit [Peptoniphilus sp.]